MRLFRIQVGKTIPEQVVGLLRIQVGETIPEQVVGLLRIQVGAKMKLRSVDDIPTYDNDNEV